MFVIDQDLENCFKEKGNEVRLFLEFNDIRSSPMFDNSKVYGVFYPYYNLL